MEGPDEQREHKINWTGLPWSLLKHVHVKARKCLQSKIMDNGVRHKQSRRFLDVECIDEEIPADAAWVRGREDPQQGCWWYKTGRSGWYARGSCWHPEIPEIHWFLYCEGNGPQEQSVQTTKSSLLQDTPAWAREVQTFNTNPKFWPRDTLLFFLIFHKNTTYKMQPYTYVIDGVCSNLDIVS